MDLQIIIAELAVATAGFSGLIFDAGRSPVRSASFAQSFTFVVLSWWGADGDGDAPP